MNKFVQPRPYADPELAARKIIELANAVEPVQDGRIHIEKINGPMLFQLKATPAEYKAGLDRAIAKGCHAMKHPAGYRVACHIGQRLRHLLLDSIDIAHHEAFLVRGHMIALSDVEVVSLHRSRNACAMNTFPWTA